MVNTAVDKMFYEFHKESLVSDGDGDAVVVVLVVGVLVGVLVVVVAAKDLGTQSTLLKTLGNLWNDNNNIDLPCYLSSALGANVSGQ